jgi:hypothetical protein
VLTYVLEKYFVKSLKVVFACLKSSGYRWRYRSTTLIATVCFYVVDRAIHSIVHSSV